jgi:hypothetical protein
VRGERQALVQGGTARVKEEGRGEKRKGRKEKKRRKEDEKRKKRKEKRKKRKGEIGRGKEIGK